MSTTSTTEADWVGQQVYRMTDSDGTVHLAESDTAIGATLCGYERPLGRVRTHGEHSAFPDAPVCPKCAEAAAP